jgi:acetyltransferase-like isoleucine patch superfamily enzyme/glycosyltransferase involved in cell wall biosynthesis
MNSKPDKYLLVQTAIGDYRQSVINKLEDILGADLEICCGDVYFDNSTFTRVSFTRPIKKLRNIYLFSRKVLFQYGATYKAIKAENVILEMNPRIINTWVIAIIRRLLAKPVVMWGHAWPREGKEAKTDKIRAYLRNLASLIVVYTEQQKEELLDKYPNLNIIVAPNSLYPASQMFVTNNKDRYDFIYVGRLVQSKKVVFLIEAFIAFLQKHNNQTRLIIVGEGPELTKCKMIVEDSDVDVDRILFKGHVSDIETLRLLYSTALTSVSPGYVGLSITQSFAFGVPMIISKDEKHSPELEAAIIDSNAVYFQTDSIESLSKTMLQFINGESDLKFNNQDIVDQCKKSYSIDLMAERIKLALELEIIHSPDNKHSSGKRMLRALIRKIRLKKAKLILGHRLVTGNNVYWGKNSTLSPPQFIKISNNFSAGANFFLQTNLITGRDCLISSNVSFVGHDHDLNSCTQSLYWSGKSIPSTVKLEGNNLIGFGATILGNVVVGKGAVIAAGALVIESVEPYTVVAGVPAKVIKRNSK